MKNNNDRKHIWRFVVVNKNTNQILAHQKEPDMYASAWNHYYRLIRTGNLDYITDKDIKVTVVDDNKFNELLKLDVNKDLTR